ncbi:MAG: META domain-containing protein [Oscillospiraceae bacterium]|nr:META domain-containing protein [Oscillospiraceae bacterium]
MKKKALLVLCALLIMVSLGACADPETAIIGTWECLNDSIPHEWMCGLVFDEDGRFVDSDGDRGSFQIARNSLTLEFDDFEAVTFSYRIRGDQLTLTGDETNVVLTRR